MRGRRLVIDMGPGAGEHGGRVVAEGTAAEVARKPRRRSPARTCRAGARSPVPAAPRAGRRRWLAVRGASENNLRDIDVEFPLGRFVARHRGVRLGQVDPGQRDRCYQALARPAAPAARSRRARTSAIEGLEALRQGDRHRPVADRPHAALEPGDLHRPVRPRSASSTRRRPTRGCAATSRGGSRSTSRAAAARRARATARSRSRCTSCPTSTCRARLQGPALQPRDARGRATRASRSPTCSRCRSRRRSTFFAKVPPLAPAAADAARRRARLHPARPAGDDAVGRRGAARQAGDASCRKVATGRTLYILDEPTTGLHFADVEQAARGAAAAGRRGQHGGRDRAQPRRDQAGRLGDRPRARGR